MISDTSLQQRFPMTIRYASEMGWLDVRDPFTGEWHRIRSTDAPSCWRREAYAEKYGRRQPRDRKPVVSRETAREEAAF